MKRDIPQEEEEEPEPWPDATEHFVLIGQEFRVMHAVEPDPDDEKDTGTVVYEAGDEFPEEHMDAGVWRAFGSDIFAALDENGQRLDETYDDEDGVNVNTVLSTWRQNNGADNQVYVCEKCGKEFETADGLNGHQSAHRDD